MLKLRPSKRAAPRASRGQDLRFDIRDDAVEVGQFVYNRGQARGEFNLRGDRFTVDSRADCESSLSANAAQVRKSTAPVYTLKAAGEGLLARAERDRDVFVIAHGGESYILQASRSRRYFHLQREGDVVPLGGVGRRGFWAKSLEMNLPQAFTASFQVFLASLLLDLNTQRTADLAM